LIEDICCHECGFECGAEDDERGYYQSKIETVVNEPKILCFDCFAESLQSYVATCVVSKTFTTKEYVKDRIAEAVARFESFWEKIP
jgi:hypothetical protein